jgi:hypothetical protein
MVPLKSYFLVPHHDISADDSLALGGIILDPLDPSQLLNEGQIADIPIVKKHSSHKYDWESVVEDAKDGRISVWTRFVNLLGLGGSFGADSDVKTFTRYKFHGLETVYFNPDPAYVEETVKKPAVLACLKRCAFKLPLYMVTGLKIVRGPGAAVTQSKTQQYGGHAGIGMSAPFGTPYVLDTGDFSRRQASREETSFGGSSDFVFAYRLSRISFTKFDIQSHVAKQEKYTAGALLGATFKRNTDDCASNFMEGLIVEAEDAVRRDLRGIESVTAIDEDNEQLCECFVVPLEG